MKILSIHANLLSIKVKAHVLLNVILNILEAYGENITFCYCSKYASQVKMGASY